MTSPRFTSSERDRDVLQALEQYVRGRLVTVERYTARAVSTARIPLNAPRRPAAVLCVFAAQAADPTASLLVVPNLNFIWDSGSRTAQVYEPPGVAANVVYRLIFLVLEG